MKNTITNSTISQIKFNNDNSIITKIIQNKKAIEKLEKKLSNLKHKEKCIDDLSNLSKGIYAASIPVALIFTLFIQMIASDFNLYEYLFLNGITIPFAVYTNLFICGTNSGRKKQLANINSEIKITKNELKSLCQEIVGVKKNPTIINNKKYTIKPIDRTYENINSKPLTKQLTK